MIDLAIVGSGPAALTAAIYASRSGYKTEVIEKAKIGGALTEISKLENYPGFVGTGSELASQLRSQAELSGAKISYGEVKKVTKQDKTFQLEVDDETVQAKAVLIATGSEPIKLGFELDVPVSYCAFCDGPLYKDKNIAVVGGANSAIQESLYLADIAKTVHVYSHSNFRAEQCLIKKAESQSNIVLHENIEPTAAELNQYDGVFVFIGKRPATTFLPKELLDEKGYIIADDNISSLEGLFAAGDVRKGTMKQAVSATADGAYATVKIIEYLKNYE